MIGGVLGVSQMGYVQGIYPYHAYRQRGVAAGANEGQNTGVQAASVSGTQAGQSAGMASSIAGMQTGRRIGPSASVSGVPGYGVVMAGRGASPETPVEPVSPIGVIGTGNTRSIGIPFLRAGMDPAELAVRMRMQYADSAGADDRMSRMPGAGTRREAAVEGMPGETGTQGVQEALGEEECQTCKERKYQDGSDDSGVSYQTPTHIDPDQAASAVRGHEMEHVVRERASAEREDRRVVSQSVTMHTAICPECGKVYVSGGTTRTATASNPEPVQPEAEQQPEEGFSAAA